jgi:anti-sigma factor (TIGR02949 family)
MTDTPITETPCDHCERMMQPYMDRMLSSTERAEAELHLAECEWCAKRYRFETTLRQYVRVAISEPMPAELKAKLAALRTPL